MTDAHRSGCPINRGARSSFATSERDRRGPRGSAYRLTRADKVSGRHRAKVVEAAPGHLEAVRSFVFDPLTTAQVKQLTNIGQRIMHAIDPDDDYLKRF